jgi:hypothetical protein
LTNGNYSGIMKKAGSGSRRGTPENSIYRPKPFAGDLLVPAEGFLFGGVKNGAY